MENSDKRMINIANFHIYENKLKDINFNELIGDKLATKFLGSELDNDINVTNEINGKFLNELEYKIMLTRTHVTILFISKIGYFILINKIND